MKGFSRQSGCVRTICTRSGWQTPRHTTGPSHTFHRRYGREKASTTRLNLSTSEARTSRHKSFTIDSSARVTVGKFFAKPYFACTVFTKFMITMTRISRHTNSVSKGINILLTVAKMKCTTWVYCLSVLLRSNNIKIVVNYPQNQSPSSLGNYIAWAHAPSDGRWHMQDP